MWDKGSCLQDSSFCLENVYRDEKKLDEKKLDEKKLDGKKLDEDSVTVPVQSRITAYWPDGTVNGQLIRLTAHCWRMRLR